MAGTWVGIDGILAAAVDEQSRTALGTYRHEPRRVGQDANIERSIAEGAYAKRQLFELVQNAADAMRDGAGRCEVVLTADTLYVANSGEPFGVDGVIALMGTHDSVKRDDQIGRFGLGFKSLLAVTDSPRIFSRSGSFVFDREESRRRIGRIVPGQDNYPVMRWATAVDPSDARHDDTVLDGLMKWAATVVVAPLKRDRTLIAQGLRTFPAEFLLFSQHVERLDLEDREDSGVARSITLGRDDSGALVLNDSGRRSTWVVRTERHHPSKQAIEDGGYSAARASVDVTWAAPVEGAPKGIGTFWAYFPTQSPTTLSGIVNAPWKLADDRESLLSGAFNDEILTQVLPKIVVGSLAEIHRDNKPTAVLDVLPARGKEARNHADDILNDPIMKAVAQSPCIPTLSGTLRHPTRAKLHPDDLLTAELELWASACADPEAWTSHAVVSKEHRAKVTRLLGYHGREPVELRAWIEHLVKTPTVEGSAAAVRLVSLLIERRPELRPELSKARILLLDDGSVDACRRGQVFLPGGRHGEGRLIIDPALAGDAQVEAALRRLGIEIFDEAGELRSELTEQHIRWDRVWAAARKNTLEESEAIFRDVLGDEVLNQLQVRTYSGKWKKPGDTFLPGAVVPGDGSRDVDFVVDPRYHQQDLGLLERLGLVESPRSMSSAPSESWRRANLDEVREWYRREKSQPGLADAAIDVEHGRVLWPVGMLTRLSDEGRAALTDKAMQSLSGDERWKVFRKAGGAALTVDDPVWSFLRSHGRLRTPVGVQPITRCLRWDADLAEIDDVPQPLPFAEDVSDIKAEVLRLKDGPGELRPEDWSALIDQSGGWEPSRRFLLYAWAAYCGQPPPRSVKVQRGVGHVEVAPEQAAVTWRADVFASLVSAGVPAVLTTSKEDFEHLHDGWGLADGEDMLTESVDYEVAGEPFELVDRFPPLRNSLEPEQHNVVVLPCKRLELLTATPTGQQSRPLDHHFDENTVYVTTSDEREMLAQIARALETTFKPDVVLRRMQEQRRNKLRQDIAAAPDVLDKLVLAIGVEELRGSVPTAALEGLKHQKSDDLTDREIARLALAVDGYAILQSHVAALSRKNLDPPSVWAGRRTAREWVRELGFPIEFAGFTGSTRATEIEVEGPPVMGDLHEYQRVIADRLQRLLDPASEIRRGLLSLPTGAGKTRVAVQALVEQIRHAGTDVRIVWLAETDELCEQAVQTWSTVWRALGSPGIPLTLSRLWAGNEPEERDGHQVVVASLAKLDSVLRRNDGNWQESYGWLVEPTIIVVDEAHRSINSQHTQVLSAIGGARNVASMTTPLVGLTATPFRGFNERETEALAGRYHRNLLDDGVFPGDDVYGYLQENGVLARIRHRELQGADLVLTEEELQHTEKMRRLPESVENRLGHDDARNNAIVRSVLELGNHETALLFATSVENAKVLAALLTYQGVEARAVAGTTDPHARRRYIEDFRSKRVRVLTNYNVFTEGFDVPKVDAVFITRPTFSPNVYQQMIGRGLRGPLNGGKEEVLIVNVADNLTNFGQEFAFRHFEHLWSRGVSS